VTAGETTAREKGSTSIGSHQMRWSAYGPEGAETVLLLHGIYAGAHDYEWRRLIPELAGEFRLRVPDLLGAGASDRPDRSYDAAVVTDVVRALIADVGDDAHVVASSLTGAHALRAVAQGQSVASLTLITPTGLGRPREGHRGRPVVAVAYEALRRTPVGDAFVWALTSGPSVSWFQRHMTYQDPDVLDQDELEATRDAGRAAGAKHLQLAFVFDQLSIDLRPADVAAVRPHVIWADGQGFTEGEEASAWVRAGADVHHLPSGLPQVEEPARVAELVRRFSSS